MASADDFHHFDRFRHCGSGSELSRYGEIPHHKEGKKNKGKKTLTTCETNYLRLPNNQDSTMAHAGNFCQYTRIRQRDNDA